MKTPLATFAAATLITVALPLSANPAAEDLTAAPDSTYHEKLAHGNLAEVAAGSLAQEKARAEEVKEFGEHMIRDHGDMLAEQKSMADKQGIALPEQPDAEHQAAMDKLSATPPEQFDREYMAQMVKDHEKTLALVQAAAANADDPSLKQMATNAESRIREHLELARETLANLEAGTGEER
jgi:putative membrane protein